MELTAIDANSAHRLRCRRKYGGAGLGLSICTQLVKLMSGTIDVTSIPSQGSNFHFSIRVLLEHNEAKKRSLLAQGLLRELDGCRIIVIDKFKSTVDMVRQMLPGISVDGAISIEEIALKKTSSYTIVVIGLLLAHDQNYKFWSAHIHQILEKARCVAIIHYPTGAIENILGKNQLTVELGKRTCNTRVPRASSVQLSSSALMIRTSSGALSSTRQRVIVRVPIPLPDHILKSAG